MIALAPTASLEVVQVALPLVLTVMAGQSGLELPLIVNVTVPAGDTAKGPPASCAVKVTAVLTLVELEGDALTPDGRGKRRNRLRQWSRHVVAAVVVRIAQIPRDNGVRRTCRSQGHGRAGG